MSRKVTKRLSDRPELLVNRGKVKCSVNVSDDDDSVPGVVQFDSHKPQLELGVNIRTFYPATTEWNPEPASPNQAQLKWLRANSARDSRLGRTVNDHIGLLFPANSYGNTEDGQRYNRSGLTFQQVLYIEHPDKQTGQKICNELYAFHSNKKITVETKSNNTSKDTKREVSFETAASSPFAKVDHHSKRQRKNISSNQTPITHAKNAPQPAVRTHNATLTNHNQRKLTSIEAENEEVLTGRGYELNRPADKDPNSVITVKDLPYSNGHYRGEIGEFSRMRCGDNNTFKWNKGPWKGCIYTGPYRNDEKYAVHSNTSQSSDSGDSSSAARLGTMKFRNGDVYCGEFQNDRIRGIGTGTYARSGDVYVGEWEDNEKCGTGKMNYGNGDTYEGTWDPIHHREAGIYRFKDGSVYEGQYFNGAYHGHGKLTDPNGVTVHDGEWNDGDAVESSAQPLDAGACSGNSDNSGKNSSKSTVVFGSEVLAVAAAVDVTQQDCSQPSRKPVLGRAVFDELQTTSKDTDVHFAADKAKKPVKKTKKLKGKKRVTPTVVAAEAEADGPMVVAATERAAKITNNITTNSSNVVNSNSNSNSVSGNGSGSEEGVIIGVTVHGETVRAVLNNSGEWSD